MTKKFQLRTLAAVAAFTVFSAMTAPLSATLLDEAVWFEREVGDGLVWKYYHFDNLFGGKQSVSFVEVDLDNPNVDLAINFRDSYVGPSPGVNHPSFPRARTSILAPEIPGAKAAVNGTYFNTQSYDPNNPTTPWGGGTTYLKVDGNVIHTFDGTNVNRHLQGILFNDKNDLEISRKTTGWANVQSNWQNMMISGPVLIDNGVIETYDSGNSHANARHPRTAIGLIDATNTLILLTVDGRTNQALGMSCTELAQVLQALGCDNAINLDGGGSTTLWAAQEPNNGILNYPSDNSAYDRGGERGAANVFVVTSTDATPAPWDGRISSITHNDIVRTGEILEVTVEYENIGTETWTSSNVSVVPSRAFGRNSSFIPDGEESTFFTMTPSTVAPGQSATITLNLDPPTVSNDTIHEEFFALWHETEGYFGPADNELRVNVLVRPELVGAPPTQTIHADLDNPFYNEGTGSFFASTVSFPLLGRNATERMAWTSTLNSWAEYTPDFPVAGTYTVEIAYPASTNSISTVQYIVTHADGSDTFVINQKANANTWVELGEFTFNESTSKSDQTIRITNGSTGSSTGNDRFYFGAARIDFVEFATTIEDWSLFD